MNVGDLNKVWEVKALKKPGEDEARQTLERIAKQVQPIMRRRKWRVKVLSEFCPTNPSLLGLNVGGGLQVKLRLRRHGRDWDFIPFEQVLDTMLHELCHNQISPHNAEFYKLWDELRKECDELMAKGISGPGQGFDAPRRRLGGFSHQPPLSSLRQTALAAAEKRRRVGDLLPSGPRRFFLTRLRSNLMDQLPKSICKSICEHLFLPIVKEVYLLKGVSRELLLLLVTKMKAEYIPPREDVIMQNEAPDDVYVVVSGEVEIINSKAEKEHVIGTLGTGDIFGEVSALCDRPQSFTFRTRTLSQLLRLKQSTLREGMQAKQEDSIVMLEYLICYDWKLSSFITVNGSCCLGSCSLGSCCA